MLFTLEALDADHGDSLILHYGKPDDPKIILIDGGPSQATYTEIIKERLLQIKKELFPKTSEQLPIEMVMVSHIDDDHIDGLLAMTEHLIFMDQQNVNLPFDVRTLWHNSFDDILNNDKTELFNALSASVMAAGVDAPIAGIKGADLDGYSRAIVASVGQGRDLRKNAKALGIVLNAKSGGTLVSAPAKGKRRIDFGDGLKLTIVGPHENRLKKLQTKWRAFLRDLEKKKKSKKEATAAALAGTSKRDTSVANLSSIVVLAEVNGKSMLLTGDALDADVLFGLEQAKLIKPKGRLHVDVLKLPHHGSDRNVSLQFFKRVTADHYVISADGKHHNPDLQTLEWLDKARFQLRNELDPDAFTLHLTHRTGKEGLGKKLDDFIKKKENRGRNYQMLFRGDNALSMKIELLKPIDY